MKSTTFDIYADESKDLKTNEMNSIDDFIKQKFWLNYNYLNNAKICYNVRIININIIIK
jgi:hypothetical protein